MRLKSFTIDLVTLNNWKFLHILCISRSI